MEERPGMEQDQHETEGPTPDEPLNAPGRRPTVVPLAVGAVLVVVILLVILGSLIAGGR